MDEVKKFDAADLQLSDDAFTEIEILDRAKKPTGIFIEVYSREGEAYRKTVRKQQNRRLKQIGKRGGVQLTAEENEMENLELLVACTKGWRGMVWHGQEMAFTPAGAMEIYSKVQVIRDQVDDAISDATLFH